MELEGIFLLIEITLISIFIIRYLGIGQSVGRLILGAIGLSLSSIIFAGYFLDVIVHAKITSLNMGLLFLPFFFLIIILLKKYNHQFLINGLCYNKKYLVGLLFVFFTCFIIGIAPSFPDFLPIGSGDTQHHYAAALDIFKNSELPRSSENFYPFIHHGLIKVLCGQEPLGFHVLTAIIARIFGIDPIFVLFPFIIFIISLISVTIYELALEVEKNVLSASLSGIIAFISGLFSISIGGTLYMLLGYFFLIVTILFLFDFDKHSSICYIIVSLIFNTAIILTYTPMIIISVPLIISMMYIKRKNFNLKQILFTLIFFIFTSFFAMLCIGNFYIRITQGETIGWVSRYGGILSKLKIAISSDYSAPIIWFGIILLLILIYIVYTLLKSEDNKLPFINSIFIVSTIFALFPFLRLITHPSSLYYPGYNYSMFTTLLIISITSIFILNKIHNLKIILLAISINHIISVIYFLIWYPTNVDGYGLYYYSKHIMFASCLIPIMLPAIFSNFSTSVKIIANDRIKLKIRKIIFCILIVIIIISLFNQTYKLHEGLHNMKPSITLEEYRGMEWMRQNYLKIFPEDNYEYYIILDNTRARWFVAITQHQFNMRSIKGDWIHPPWPLSIDITDFCERAQKGDIVILDEVIDNETPKIFKDMNAGDIYDYKYNNKTSKLQLTHKKGPIIFIKLMDKNSYDERS